MSFEKLDPGVRALLDSMKAMGRPALETLPVAEARQMALESSRVTGAATEEVASVEDIQITGPDGPIPIRIYTPANAAPRPAVVYFHGGGWVLCSLETHDSVCRAIANRAGAVVVAVDYRLAPEHPFPAAVTDCYAATQWVSENAGLLGIDAARMSVGGDSAGGTLSTVVSLKSREEKGPPIAAQIMIYPVTDFSALDTASYQEFADGFYLTKALMRWFRDHYLGAGDGRHPHASPLLQPDLYGLPPALIITAECDVLRDEGEAYARRLREAGVPVTLQRYDGMIHPFFTLGGAVPRAFEAIEQFAKTVREAKS